MPVDKLPDSETKRSWVVPALRDFISAAVGQPFPSSVEVPAAPDSAFRVWRSTLRTRSPAEKTTVQSDTSLCIGAAGDSRIAIVIVIMDIIAVNMGVLRF